MILLFFPFLHRENTREEGGGEKISREKKGKKREEGKGKRSRSKVDAGKPKR